MATSILFFSSKTEQSRIVAIHRPIVITQERKTPAYYVYQQAQNLQQKKPALQVLPTTYLSNLSLTVTETKLQIAEMKFSKKEFILKPEAASFRSLYFSNKLNPEIKKLSYEQILAPMQVANSFGQEPTQSPVVGPAQKWATIRGKFELIEGVGITDHHIEIKRIEEGLIREVGSIDLKAGSYSIDIGSPNGYLIAQIKDRNGSLIGEDRERLVNLQSRGTFFEGPFIRVGQPATIAANPDLPAYASSGKKTGRPDNKISSAVATTQGVSATLFDNQNTLENPTDVFSNISKYSSTISRVFDASGIYKNVTTIRQTGDKTETAMFTTKWVRGVIEYISDIQKIEFKSKGGPIIIGRVLSDGKPVINAKIQIDSAPGIIPVYFDQFMIPSFTQSETSENGYFMFVGIEPGNYHLVATKQNATLGSQMFIAEEDSLAYQNITSMKIPRSVIVRTFDAFTSTPVDTDVILPELEEALETESGVARYKTFTQSGLREYLVRTNDRRYVPIRYTQNAGYDYAHLPMIQESWLAAIKTFKQIEDKPDTGIIIGFTTDLNYEAYLVSEKFNKNDIVYFNSSGQIISAPVTGGGFILYNVPTGARELVLQEKNSERIYSQVFNVLAEQVSISHFIND